MWIVETFLKQIPGAFWRGRDGGEEVRAVVKEIQVETVSMALRLGLVPLCMSSS
ncbi:MAG: hypothetical protein QW707_06315 [Candidatus Bathyarchaeia archaeon]